ncbi:hypothetical protein Msub_20515 [Marinobacter subterrani]|uniref:Uncharacterized protein n=2 Tax=Marinobacter subterrani TaxID=1658765 RepID=A0A0J7J5S8_9GAMM|nr:hypothetical protein Msub_20515 [Marinobacter subterrani]
MTFWRTSEDKVFRMLADENSQPTYVGTLETTVFRSGEWLCELIKFISRVLPNWRDDPNRQMKTSETALTAQLCARLNSASNHTPGWDFLQFRREEPDEIESSRSIDLVAAPNCSRLNVDGINYTEYKTLLPIECKRLPTPSGKDRDEREYLYSQFKTTGGVQRFKAGHHAASHERAAMIAYVQDESIPYWVNKIETWISGLESGNVDGWSASDHLEFGSHDTVSNIATLFSNHSRSKDLNPIDIDHLWIEM